jgi:hypothetical protein
MSCVDYNKFKKSGNKKDFYFNSTFGWDGYVIEKL